MTCEVVGVWSLRILDVRSRHLPTHRTKSFLLIVRNERIFTAHVHAQEAGE
jgi:hypothetical protein